MTQIKLTLRQRFRNLRRRVWGRCTPAGRRCRLALAEVHYIVDGMLRELVASERPRLELLLDLRQDLEEMTRLIPYVTEPVHLQWVDAVGRVRALRAGRAHDEDELRDAMMAIVGLEHLTEWEHRLS